MITATAVIGAAAAEFCATRPDLPECIAYMARMAAIEPWLKGVCSVEIVALIAIVLTYRIKTGNWWRM